MSKNLTIVEITEYELDQLHADLDNAGNELFLQEGKIKELEAKNRELECLVNDLKNKVKSFDAYVMRDEKLKITVEALQLTASSVNDRLTECKRRAKQALAAINREGV